MTLKEKINADLKAAMLNKDVFKRELLKVVKSEIARLENSDRGVTEFNDSDTQRFIQTMIKNAKEISSSEALLEIEILSKYLPQQITEAEAKSYLEKICSEKSYSSKKDMRNLLSDFNEKYSGAFDAKELGRLASSLLS